MTQFFQTSPAGADINLDRSRFEDGQGAPKVFIVDDEYFARSHIQMVLEEAGFSVDSFETCESFLEAYRPHLNACLVLDIHLPGMGGLELLRRTNAEHHLLPTIIVSGSSAISDAVQAMKAGALDFIEKPAARDVLVTSVRRALRRSADANAFRTSRKAALDHMANLTPRQREIMRMVLAGHPSKNIAADLGISQRTVENHRSSIMHKMGAKSVPILSSMTLAAVWRPGDENFSAAV
jgi:two-component system CheB/CheR fusion protein